MCTCIVAFVSRVWLYPEAPGGCSMLDYLLSYSIMPRDQCVRHAAQNHRHRDMSGASRCLINRTSFAKLMAWLRRHKVVCVCVRHIQLPELESVIYVCCVSFDDIEQLFLVFGCLR